MHEPDPGGSDADVAFERFDFVYPVRPYDCEAMFVDHLTGDLYLITKEASPEGGSTPPEGYGQVFVARAPLTATGTPQTLERLGSIDMDMVTAADMSTDGLRVAVRNYGQIRIYTRTSMQTAVADMLKSTSYTLTSYGALESIAFEGQGYGLLTCPEGGTEEDPQPQPLSYFEWQ